MAIVVVAVACRGTLLGNNQVRWYSTQQVAQGELLYAQNCMVCHGVAGVGAPNWQERRADGSLKPPPLNGTAHAWHHTLAVLNRTIIEGGAASGGTMPAFGDKLNAVERNAIIAYLQSQWSDRIYNTWANNVEQMN